MHQEAHCYKCRTQLGQAEGSSTSKALPIACQATRDTLVFTVACPKCGAVNHVKIKY